MVPNTTPTPNILFDVMMRDMKDTELRVTLQVIRATYGWMLDIETRARKQEDWISRSQLEVKTGRSGKSLSTAIEACIAGGFIEARAENGEVLDSPDKRSGRKIFYRIGEAFATCEKSTQVEPVNIFPQTSEKSTPQPVKKVHTTKETLTKEIIQKKDTPSEIAKAFFEGQETYEATIQKLLESVGPTHEEFIRAEMAKFNSYWTEPNKSGTKQRWQSEQHFDVHRRIGMWMRNAVQFNKGRTTSRTLSPKGIRI